MQIYIRPKSAHLEKCFVESIKIWLAQQDFSFKFESMEILFKLTKKTMLFFAIPTKKIASSAKKWNCKLKLQNYCSITEKILLILEKL